MLLTRREALALLAAMPAWRAGAQTDDPTVWSVAEAAVRVARREISPLELAEAYLQRIASVDRMLGAYVTVAAERARADARDAAARLGAAPTAVLGVPIAHKDLFETAGIRTTAGSRLFERHVPVRDAAIVARLARAGTILLGKTNTHELGGGVTTINPFFGTTRNPVDPSRIAGGSSGGSAAAVAARLAAAATGSDTGGSIRIPAAFCGVVGLKPTFGLVSTAGLLGTVPTLDHAGLLTRTVEDAAVLLDVVAGYDPDDASTVRRPPGSFRAGLERGVRGLRVAVPRAFFFEGLEPGVARAVESALDRLRAKGAEVHDRDLPIDGETMGRVFDPIVIAEVWERLGDDWRARPDAFSKGFAGFFQAPVPGGVALAAAHRARRAFEAAMRAVFEEVDLVATPTVAVTAPPIDGPIPGGLILRNTWPFNAARLPAISVPCGTGDGGRPVGLQLVAGPFQEARLLRAAHAV